MIGISLRGNLPLMAAVGLLALVGGLVGRGQDEKPKPQVDAAKEEAQGKYKTLYFGYAACADCHDRKKDDPYRDPKNPPLCRCTEVSVWLTDKHQGALKALHGDRGKQMGKLLGYAKDVTQEAKCLSCHGVNDTVASHFDKSFKDPIQEGVTCVVCHGPADEWVERHAPIGQQKKEAWRGLKRDDKEKNYGMTDLWNPAKRTRKCVSCHVGNVGEGKFVSHDMYAAGHPPLPGIEIATFSDDMPRHWEYIKEKKPIVQALLGFDSKTQTYEKTKLVAVSSVVTLAESLRLVGDQAVVAERAGSADARILDFATFDCYACHHDLRSPSWRQQRGFVGRPGRPQMRPWPTVLAGASLQELAQPQKAGAQLDEGLVNLYKAFDAQPFGVPKEIGAVAGKLAESLNHLGDELAKDDKQLDQAQVQDLLRRLCAFGEKTTADYDSARQIAWAFEIIYLEWKPEQAGDRLPYQMKALREYLKLQLPSGNDKQIETELPVALRKLNDYYPETFKEHMRKLSQLLR